MHDIKLVKKAIIEVRGLIHYKGDLPPYRYRHFGILSIKDAKHLVILPEEPSEKNSVGVGEYKGLLWEVILDNGVPVMTGQHFHFFSHRSTNINEAVKAFNSYYRFSKLQPGEISQVFTIASPEETKENKQDTPIAA